MSYKFTPKVCHTSKLKRLDFKLAGGLTGID